MMPEMQLTQNNRVSSQEHFPATSAGVHVETEKAAHEMNRSLLTGFLPFPFGVSTHICDGEGQEPRAHMDTMADA